MSNKMSNNTITVKATYKNGNVAEWNCYDAHYENGKLYTSRMDYGNVFVGTQLSGVSTEYMTSLEINGEKIF